MVMRSWLSIGKLLNLQGKYNLAVKNLLNCIDIATENFGDEYYLSQAYYALGKAYAGVHDYEKAYKAFAEYDTLKNLIFTAESDQRISQLRTKFDVADKEGTISLQEDLIQKQKARQTQIIVIAVLLFLLLLLAYKAISNNRKKNRLLQKQNEEKEFLLKEIHHRVKNNLEIVSSLLSLQSAQIDDVDVLKVMAESQHRVQTMGMIHQKLYMGKNLAAVEMKDYFKNLVDYILDAYGMEQRISIEVIMDTYELDIDVAIPIGLIVNELLTNALKYAFPNEKKGTIQIRLANTTGKLQLDVNDDGIGMNTKNKKVEYGFGTQLIALLTKQLNGKIELNTEKGTAVSIQFQSKKSSIMMNETVRILIVEDDMIIGANLSLQLVNLGYEVTGIETRGEEAIAHAMANTPDIILMDINLKGALNGIETVAAIQNIKDIPIIFLTANSDVSTFFKGKGDPSQSFYHQAIQ